MWLFIIFVAVPIIEIVLFIEIGSFLGLFPTLLIVIITAALGTYLVRSQALSTLKNLKRQLDELQNPTEYFADGAMILFSGALLLTPGFFTDAVGFLLLTPWFRSLVFKYLKQRWALISKTTRGQEIYKKNNYRKSPRNTTIIEGEYQEVTRTKPTDKDR